MNLIDLGAVKQAATRILDEAHGPIPATQLLEQVAARGHDQDEVVSAVRQMLDSGDIRFDRNMNLVLTRQMA